MASSIETTSTTTTFKNQNTTYITVDTNNNIGIGTTTPAVNLNVAKSADGVAARFQRTSGGGLVDIETYNGIGGIGTGDNIPFRINTNSTERVRILTDGKVGVGTANVPSNKNTVTPTFNIAGSGVLGSAQITRHGSVGGGGAMLHLSGTRGSDVNSYTVLQNGDGIGTLSFQAADGGEFVAAAEIVAKVDGTPGDNDMPGRLIFSTTADGASAPTERMRLTSTGNLAMTSPTSVTGLQAFTIDWYNENNAGIMASIGCDRTASSAAPGDLVFRTSTSVDSGAISEKMRVTSAGDLKFNSGYGSTATAYGCRARVNFNGTSTVAIRASGNVSSITDNAVGDYTINFTTAMPDVNYSTIGMCVDLVYGSSTYINPSTYSTTAVRLLTRSGYTAAPGTGDPSIACIAIFR